MAMRSEDVTLLVGSLGHNLWESYDIDSDLLTPADAWQMSLGIAGQTIPAEVVPGADVTLKIGADIVLSGKIDERRVSVRKGEHILTLSGRDGAAVLVDCSAPIFTARQQSLEEVIGFTVIPLGVHDVRVDAQETHTMEKVTVNPGDSAWDVLRNVAEANGLWPWFEPNGTLVVGGPDYSKPPVAKLTLRYDGKGNNVECLERVESMVNRYSDMTVLGQSHGTEKSLGKNAEMAMEKDSDWSQYRPKIVIDSEAQTLAIAQSRARKLLADGHLSGETLTATVHGHRIYAPNEPGDGMLWTPGQRVQVESEPHGLNAIYFLTGRRFVCSRHEGKRTILELKEDGVWVLDAHPHTKTHRKAKAEDGQTLEILEILE